ncbi:hypothetical protein CBOM_00246 [Ceraceosorus bombacis]|uniref:Uncharacterized protein n=1 Tax=Ceraceosorus bombacis TaxID=401625 RepID=A0A0P1A3Q3_9BASI|nr:hypothetical protein CBOM_00246 [Ceraceosorus bombacis]
MDVDEKFKALLEAMPEPVTDKQSGSTEKSIHNAVTSTQKASATLVQQRRMKAIFKGRRKVKKQEEAVAKREEDWKARGEKADAQDAALTKSQDGH